MNAGHHEFSELQSLKVTVIEEDADGRQTVRTFASLDEVPEILRAAFGSPTDQELNALDLGDLVRRAYEGG